MRNTILPMNLQLFADDPEGTQTATITPTTVTPVVVPPVTTPSGKTYSEDYVHTIREEAKGYRLAKKNAELRLKELIGLTADEDLTDAKITSYQSKVASDKATALTKANDRLILAEVKSLEGYDSKLVLRLLDKNDLTIADDGTITGLTEAVAKLELEIPQIKLVAKNIGGTNPVTKAPLLGLDALREEHKLAMKSGNLAEAIGLKNKIFELEHKQ